MSLFHHALLAAAMAALGLAAPSAAQPATEAAKPAEASIPFVNHGGIRDWQAVGDEQIYIQASGGQWYLATLAASAPDLPFATTIGFETKGVDRLDRFGSVVVAGTTYALTSLVESGPPPRKK